MVIAAVHKPEIRRVFRWESIGATTIRLEWRRRRLGDRGLVGTSTAAAFDWWRRDSGQDVVSWWDRDVSCDFI